MQRKKITIYEADRATSAPIEATLEHLRYTHRAHCAKEFNVLSVSQKGGFILPTA